MFRKQAPGVCADIEHLRKEYAHNQEVKMIHNSITSGRLGINTMQLAALALMVCMLAPTRPQSRNASKESVNDTSPEAFELNIGSAGDSQQSEIRSQFGEDDDIFAASLKCCAAGGICARYSSCPGGTTQVQCPCPLSSEIGEGT